MVDMVAKSKALILGLLASAATTAATVDLTLPPGDYYLVPVQPYTVVTIQSQPVDPPVLDTDGDGVNDDIDQCPDTPLGDEVDATGCTVVPPPVDSDGDGFTDDVDVCPSEPGVVPDGCPVVQPDPPQPPTETTVYLEKSLDQCIAELQTVGGGWCEMTVDARAIIPLRDDLQFEQRGVQGPASAWDTYNGAAVDKNGLRMWFHGGGHASYGGTEVYELDLVTGKLERIADSIPFDRYVKHASKDIYALRNDPNVVPESTHTYDGFNYDPDTGLLILITGYGYTEHFKQIDPPPDDVVDRGWGIYAFNPTDEEIKGIQPKQWKRLVADYEGKTGYPMSAFRGGYLYTNVSIGGRGRIVRFFWDNDEFVQDSKENYYISVQAGGPEPIMDNIHGSLWTTSQRHLLIINDDGTQEVLWHDTNNEYKDAGRSIADYGDGILTWNGIGTITEIHRDGSFRRCVTDPVNPNANKEAVFSKWFKHPGYDDIFIGWASPRGDVGTGPLVYKHDPTRCEDIPKPEAKTINDLLRESDSVVLSEDQSFWYGGKLTGSKTIDYAGANILFEGGKGFVEVQGGPHVIRGLRLDREGSTGIWAERQGTMPLNLTLEDFEIAWKGFGLMLSNDNFKGEVTLRNGVIRDGLAQVNRKGMDHLIYGGKIGKVTADNVTFQCHHEWGHLFKSRAPENYIVNSLLDQQDCDSSRLVDISCGGYTEIRNTTLIQSPIANPDMVGFAVERCATDMFPPHKLVLENTHWTARHPKAFFITAKVPVEIECIGTNTFVGIPSPCPAGGSGGGL